MSKFIWEPDERLLPGDARMSPRTAHDLLCLLNVDAADDDIQYQAVKGWLYKNEADPLLRMSLFQSGFVADIAPIGQHVNALRAETFVVAPVRKLFVFFGTEPSRRAPTSNGSSALKLNELQTS
jgi:hypothetical protein